MEEIYSTINQMYLKLATDIMRKKEELIKNKFLEITGEELTEKNSSRVQIEIPYHTSIFDKREIYIIDSVPVLEIYEPISSPNNKIDEPWKVTTEIKYREL